MVGESQSKANDTNDHNPPPPSDEMYRGTSLIRNDLLVGPYCRIMSGAVWWP